MPAPGAARTALAPPLSLRYKRCVNGVQRHAVEAAQSGQSE